MRQVFSFEMAYLSILSQRNGSALNENAGMRANFKRSGHFSENKSRLASVLLPLALIAHLLFFDASKNVCGIKIE
jgi:hypothetical protein